MTALEGLPSRPVAFSVVIPFYNEEENVGHLIEEVRAVMNTVGTAWELVAVSDGSTDGTAEILREQERTDSRVRAVIWETNRGQAAALYHGLQTARAPLVITMDGDGQNDPADIPELLAKLDGLDMVVGIRIDRSDSRLRRWMSRVANGVRAWILGDGVRDSGCALKVFRREVIAAFIPMQTLYSFMPALAVAAGFRVGQQPVRHRARAGGVSNYGLRKMLWRPLVDLLGVLWFVHRRF